MATQTIFTLPQGNYGPVNNFKTGTYTPGAGVTQISIITSIAAADLNDFSKSLSIFMECSPDGGQTWQPQASFNWLGGVTGKNGIPPTSPFIIFGVGGMIGELCRLDITSPTVINLGATVTSS